MKKERKNDDPVVFALTTETWRINKFPVDEEGNILNPDFNARTYTKKAHKAFLEGKSYFTYKGVTYAVPKILRSKLQEHLDAIDLEEEEVTNDQVIDSNIESKIKKQWG